MQMGRVGVSLTDTMAGLFTITFPNLSTTLTPHFTQHFVRPDPHGKIRTC